MCLFVCVISLALLLVTPVVPFSILLSVTSYYIRCSGDILLFNCRMLHVGGRTYYFLSIILATELQCA